MRNAVDDELLSFEHKLLEDLDKNERNSTFVCILDKF